MVTTINDFALACSGPEAGAAIAGSVFFAKMAAGVQAFLLLISLYFSLYYRGCFWQATVLGLLLALHPAWYGDGRSGDCGMMLQLASVLWIAGSVPLFGSAIRSNRDSGPQERQSGETD